MLDTFPVKRRNKASSGTLQTASKEWHNFQESVAGQLIVPAS